MTTPGPKPKPRALRVFEENPGNIPLNDREPEPEDCGDLIPPDWLSSDCPYMEQGAFNLNNVATLVWHKVAQPLEKIGVLKNIDKDKLARYCYLFSMWLKCKSFIDQYGTDHPVYSEYWGQEEAGTDKKGKTIYKTKWKRSLKKMQPYPQVSRMLALSGELNRYEAEFGIGASSRTRIQTVIKGVLEGGEAPEGSDFNYAAKDGKLHAVK